MLKIFKDKNSYDNERSIYMMLKPLMDIHKPNILTFLGAQERYDVSKEFWIVTEYHEVGSLSDFLIKYTLVSLEVFRFDTFIFTDVLSIIECDHDHGRWFAVSSRGHDANVHWPERGQTVCCSSGS